MLRIILLENSRSTAFPLGAIQDLLEPLVTPLSKGCRWNVNVPELAKSTGLRAVGETSDNLFGTLFLGTFEK